MRTKGLYPWIKNFLKEWAIITMASTAKKSIKLKMPYVTSLKAEIDFGVTEYLSRLYLVNL
ncbi:hypothetical protein SRABI96_00230 [Peribacillus sp. Bi96]|nr:hypothetical protein SRABI96_00230 [Peribacillus sp. Bi96]